MATAIKKCRVCGKPYVACHTMRNNADVFRWQEVACSPECGSIYLAQIEESRRNDTVEVNKTEYSATLVEDEDINDEFEKELAKLDEYFDDAE